MSYFFDLIYTSVTILTLFFLLRSTLYFDSEMNLKKNEEWINANTPFRSKIKPRWLMLDLCVGCLLICSYVVTKILLDSSASGKTELFFIVITGIYYFVRVASFNNYLKKIMNDVPLKNKRVTFIEARMITHYLPKWMINVVKFFCVIGVVGNLVRMIFLNSFEMKNFVTLAFFLACYSALYFVSYKILQEKSKGDLEKFQAYRKLSLYLVFLVVVYICLWSNVVMLKDIFIEASRIKAVYSYINFSTVIAVLIYLVSGYDRKLLK